MECLCIETLLFERVVSADSSTLYFFSHMPLWGLFTPKTIDDVNGCLTIKDPQAARSFYYSHAQERDVSFSLIDYQ